MVDFPSEISDVLFQIIKRAFKVTYDAEQLFDFCFHYNISPQNNKALLAPPPYLGSP